MKRLIKITIFIITTIIISVQSSGCTKKLDLEKLTIVSAFGIDKTENGFMVTAQIVNPITLARTPRDISPYVVISREGETVFEALRILAGTFTSRLFLSHFKILVFGEEIAKDGIEKHINFFFLDHEAQHRYNIMVAKEATGDDLIRIYTMLNAVSAISVHGKVEAGLKYYGIGKQTTINEAINVIRSPKGGLVLAGIEIVGDIEEGKKLDSLKESQPKAFTRATGLAIFKKDKLVDWFDDKESQGYNFIENKIASTVIPVELKENRKVSMEVSKATSKVEFKIKDNKPEFKVKIEVFATAGEDTSGESSGDIEYLEAIKAKLKEEVTKRCEAAVKKAQQNETDIFDFSGKIYRDNHKYWKTIEKDYDDIFKNMKVTIEVEPTILRLRY